MLAVRLQWPYDSQENINVIKSYLIKTIKLYLIWNLIYFPLALVYYIHSGENIVICALGYIKGLIFVGEHYNSWMLWYLLSAIYALCFVLFCLKRRISPYVILAGGTVLILLGVGVEALIQTDVALPDALLSLRKIINIFTIKGRLFQGAFYIP